MERHEKFLDSLTHLLLHFDPSGKFLEDPVLQLIIVTILSDIRDYGEAEWARGMHDSKLQ